MSIVKRPIASALSAVLATSFLAVPHLLAAPPDLTSGGVPNEDPPITINLGPTGARGWVYHVKSDTSESRQILVTAVDAGTPAAGVLAADDVILGADGTGANPVNFSSDARKSLALAIADAEARNPATLKLLRWRSGSTATVALNLQTLGTYSPTAPYNCPKSALILQNGLQYVYDHETSGRYSFGAITLLATGNPTYQAKAQTEARALIPSQATMDQMMSDERDASSMITWQRGHTLLFLAEYFLATGDTEVLPAIEAYAVNIAKNRSLFGTVGHIYADKWPDGGANGPMGGVYGVVNSAGMPCFLGVLLAKECGLNNPELDPAIEASSRFFAYYSGKGAIPYGEHEPYHQGHETNGKSGLGALYFHLQANRVEEGKFFAKMATAASNERELGHTGAFFNYLWSPLGAATGGEEAAAAHFSRIRWMLDLNRRWDGGFDYDCLNGEGPNSGSEYNDFRMSTAALLTYALPHRKLRITGKNHDANRYLTSADVTEAVQATDYNADVRSDSELISDLGSWSPKVRLQAANELGTRSISTSELSQITSMANNTGASSRSRAGACLALGEIGDSSSAAGLAALLTDSDPYVRYSAAEAMRYLPTSATLTQLAVILSAAANTAEPLFPMVEEDPLQFAHGKIATLLFYSGSAYGPKGIIWGSGINGVDRGLLYPAIRAVAETPIGFSRSTLNATYDHLTEADVLALSGTIVDSIIHRAPADKMFSNGVRSSGVRNLERFDIAEGVPACMTYAADEAGGRRKDPLALLGTFGGGVHTVEPDPDVIAFLTSYLSDGETAATAQASIDAINGDTNPTPLVALKSIQSVTADDPTVTLPATSTTLRVTATDQAQGDSVFTWRKLSGPGTVSYSRNGTAAAAITTLTFAGTAGTYQFEVTMSDSRGLTEAYASVTVDLAAGSGRDTTPPTPNPLTWASAPAPGSDTSVTMTATPAGDPSGVEYYFTCTSGPGNDSGWQDSPGYTDIGLAPGNHYTYTVTARDKSANRNMTSPSAAASATTPGTAPPLKIFILAGQSNMEGHGEMEPAETPGTLQYMVNHDPSTFAHLRDGNGWASRRDTWIWYKRDGTTVLKGDLSAGYGRYDSTIGPELQFGIEMGNAHGGQVLLIKTAWGGKSLYTNFRPPGSGWNVNPPVAAGDQGFYYREMLSYVNDVLTNLPTYFPDYNAAAGYELAGFGWHQGWNDRIDQAAVDEYEANMTNFINDVRSDLGAPNLPFVIATTGMGGWDETNSRALQLMAAQLAMEDFTQYPAFDGNVAVVDTRDFWREPTISPSQTQNYHWNRNAETYFLIGRSMALALQGLMTGSDTAPPNPNPASFAIAPFAPDDVSISMTAAAGSDLAGPVEYLFTETSGNAGGTGSGWQTSPTYTDTGLLPETLYTYTVTMRDSVGNVGSASAPASAGTASYLDVFPPTPNPAGFALAPTATSATSISMAAEPGTDESGPVEYLFTETSGNAGGTSSGWQTSPNYTDTGLVEGTQYTYTVTLRDSVGNVGTPSAPSSATATGAAGQLGILDLSVTNGGINPVTGQPWAIGNTYRVAFVTQGTRDATSPDIADYDAFVQSAAAAVGWGGGTWRCVGQTYNNPDAKANTGTSGSGGVGIFLPDGTKIADDHADLWNGSIDNKWNVTETGGIYVGAVASGSLRKFGDPVETKIEHGSSDRTNASWWQLFNGAQTSQWHFFALSDVLTVQAAGGDTTPPMPNPASFAVVPTADDGSSISMTATVGLDLSGPVEYLFTETSGNLGATSSGWQTSPSYTDSGLDPLTQYTYTVTMRDALGNAGSASSPASATTPTGPDLVAPNPDPLTWAVLPAAGAQTLIVHEGFDYSSGADLASSGGTGFAGAWTTTKNNSNAGSFLTGSPGLNFMDSFSNVLPVSGNRATRTKASGRSEAHRVLSSAARTALLADGSTMWFSVLHERSTGTEHCGFIIGTGTFDVATAWDLGSYTAGGEGFGFGSSNDEWIGAVGYHNATGLTKVDSSLNASATRLLVGKIVWNASGTNDTLSLYNVTDLGNDPTTPIATLSLDLDQANIDRITLLSNQASAAYDEIRFGTNFASVVGAGSGGNSDDTISMTATTATDSSGVEYYFTETSGNPGGDDSGWQDSPVYVDTGLQSGTQYTYTVTARDKSPNRNTTAASLAASATTTGTPPADTTPPAPNPASFAVAPTADSSSAISMTATTGSDPSGPVEYLFTETSGNPGGTSSGWQTSPSYIDTGLTPSTQYTYTITMRDALGNTGSASTPVSATTNEPIGGDTYVGWIGGYNVGGQTGFGQDPDGDNLDNGIEGFFGTAPDAANAGLTQVAKSGTQFTFRHPEAVPPLSDMTGSYEWSLDMTNWHPSGTVGDTTVTISVSKNDPVAGTTTVTADTAGSVTPPATLFVRVVATQN